MVDGYADQFADVDVDRVLDALRFQTLILTAILVPLISLLLAPAMHSLATRLMKEWS